MMDMKGIYRFRGDRGRCILAAVDDDNVTMLPHDKHLTGILNNAMLECTCTDPVLWLEVTMQYLNYEFYLMMVKNDKLEMKRNMIRNTTNHTNEHAIFLS